MGRIHRLRQRWSLPSRLGRVRLLVLDVDGVLTDGGLWYGPGGELTKRFDVRDGLGIKLLQRAGLEVAFLSGGGGGATERRAEQLGIRHCLVGVGDKPTALSELQRQLNQTPEHTAFIGDDFNDLAVRPRVGLLVATADAAAGLRRQADLVLRSRGGQGAVRELAERLLRGTPLWQEINGAGWRQRND
ncbi:HAD family hydrolase [Synechococcus sp. CS-1325]|uniref:KdsC family phosphatase n=1 Tax=unclassified Synechococcus TaxID=2626047 RepID=UPI000DB7CDC8|nr:MULTISPECIES: HAD family hydrolase [unclassified Synechococcus]MCT0198474.1 HAD family hydrolase [Synechococcus sp. CS-1325]MCT0213594.1 HAD family hydrolase [Synechococcus sp. CS-1326]MCT0232185.1 HAD family hydrolase [Synechococcus sp. CS-1327]PZV01793.1 MAG: phosphatase [Cyanobium sp.]